MNKFAKLFAGVAVVSLAASCSSDEPMGPAGGNNGTEGSLYMVVSINDAADLSRAANEINGDGEYEYGTNEGENHVSSARFLFFDENGIFYAEANPVITAGTDVKEDYIEYKTPTQIVLENQKDRALPHYLLTVLNGDGFTIPTGATLDWVHNQLQSIKNGPDFVMSTSSFIPADGDAKYDAKYPFVNVVSEDDFYPEPAAKLSNVPAVDVYVERLATKLTVVFANGNNAQEVKVTLAGDDNNEGDPNTGIKSLYVKIDGFGVTNVETQSYLSKHILDFDDANLSTAWAAWNKPAHYRSFWGKSTKYGEESPVLKRMTINEAIGNFNAVYSYETTNTLGNVQGTNKRVIEANVPCAVFTATVYLDENATETTNLVMYNGVLFKEDAFIKYVLSGLQAQEKGLDFYTLGTDDLYHQVDENYVEVGRNWELTGAACELHADKKALEGVDLYHKVDADNYVKIENAEKEITNDKGELVTIIETPADQLTQRLREFTKGVKTEYYNGGKSEYRIPIRHLRNLTADKDAQKTVDAEGQYGMVRNHHYEIVLDKITKIGSGVFNPGSGSNPGDTIPTDNPEDDTYGLGAKINILSWRIVKQNVDL